MPIIKPATTQMVVPEPKPHKESFKDITLSCDTKDELLILKEVTGTPFPVTYYHQILAANSTQHQLDNSLSPIYQSYTKINNLVIMRNGDLNESHDDQTNVTTVTGTGIHLNGQYLPNVGDMFTSVLLDGTTGLFTYTEVTRLSHLRGTHYDISFKLVSILHEGDSDSIDLKNKTSISIDYDIDRYRQGLDPYVDTNDTSKHTELSLFVKDSIRHYSNFLHVDTGSITVSVFDNNYDDYLSSFVKKTMTGFSYYHETYPIENNRHVLTNERRYNTLFDLLLNPLIGTDIDSEFKWTPRREMLRVIPVQSIAYTNIDNVLVRNDPGVSIKAGYTPPPVGVTAQDVKYLNHSDLHKLATIVGKIPIYVNAVVTDQDVLVVASELASIGETALVLYNPTLHSAITDVYVFDITVNIAELGIPIPVQPVSVNLSIHFTTGDMDINNDLATVPVISPSTIVYPVGSSNSYVLSSEFYERTDNMSKLEKQIVKYLNDDPMDVDILLDITRDRSTWSYTTSVYVIPIVILLINKFLRS